MRKGGGKAKGSSFERLICKTLSKFWSEGTSDDLCWRSASSGARATISKTKNHSYHGDITAVGPEMESFFKAFSIEAKHYKKFDLEEILRDKKAAVIGFFRQSMRSAILSKRIPLVICKKNNGPALLICPGYCRQRLFRSILKDNIRIKVITLGDRLDVFNFEKLLEAIDINRFKETLQGELYTYTATGIFRIRT